jgi:hypothetical protein
MLISEDYADDADSVREFPLPFGGIRVRVYSVNIRPQCPPADEEVCRDFHPSIPAGVGRLYASACSG